MSNLEPDPDEVRCRVIDMGEPPVPVTLDPRLVPLGGPRAMTVRRTLPHRNIRTIGAWCFIDDYGPTAQTDPPMDVRPHPHMGLQTVSWLLSGRIEHRDSTGGYGLVNPGELNLMTAGRGIAHSEYATQAVGLRGVQMWIALPESARDAHAHFAQHVDLPVTTLPASGGSVTVTVFIGEFAGVISPAHTYSPLIGAQLEASAPTRLSVPLRPEFEYGVLALDHPLNVDGVHIEAGAMRYLGWGAETLSIEWTQPGPALLIGGEPLTEQLVMWWNFVGRSHEDIAAAREQWESGDRFGRVVGDANTPLPAPPLPQVRLRARPGRQ